MASNWEYSVARARLMMMMMMMMMMMRGVYYRRLWGLDRRYCAAGNPGKSPKSLRPIYIILLLATRAFA